MKTKGENRCTDSCGLFTAWADLYGRTEYGQPYYCCRWCKEGRFGPYVGKAEGMKRRQAEKARAK